MDDCVFCKIVKGELPRALEYEDGGVIVVKSIKPIAETHLLVIPKTHKDTFLDLDGEIDSVFKAAQKVIKEKNLRDGYKLVVNGGKYQEIMHFHLHILAGKLEDESDILNQV